jgi:predicted short-subunit dehydrogenase-like oxidoreductase (DUF2520 family)
MALPEIDIIGAGNLATNLAPNLEQNGIVVNTIYSRDLKDAKQLANRLYQANITDNLDFSDSNSSVFILAVSDNAVENIARELILPEDAIVAHTSGSIPLSVLGYTASPNIGVFYPLQTFSKAKKLSFQDIPILVEGDNSYTRKTLSLLGQKISRNVQEASSKQRLMIHLAAVFASNFTNAMLLHAQDILQAINVNSSILAPLVQETFEKSFALGALKGQTGPAKRGDLDILDMHMEMLNGLEDKKEVYQLISQQILDRHKHE